MNHKNLPFLSSRNLGQTDPEQPEVRRLSEDLRNTIFFFWFLTALGFVNICFYVSALPNIATLILWALSGMAGGAAIGFLFGIPKILQGEKAVVNEGDKSLSDSLVGYRQRVNTNLEDISDWLTKIIVGLSLIHFNAIPPYLYKTAVTLSSSIGTGANTANQHMAFALAVITYFPIVGFLFGYLVTRLFLQRAFARADLAAESEREAKAVSARVSSLEIKQDLLKQSIYHFQSGSVGEVKQTLNLSPPTDSNNPDTSTDSHVVDPELLRLADIYRSISINDYGERVRRKSEVANELSDYVLRNRIPRDLLVQWIEAQENDGIIVALATMINTFPERGDMERLLRIAGKARWLHVKYRIVLAIGQLFKTGFATLSHCEEAESILSKYYETADDPLRRVINEVRSLIRLTNNPNNS